jgi:hypothetical protein
MFGLDCLRSGGATAVAAAGAEDRLFKKHGRWKTDRANKLRIYKYIINKH